jgi:hypothetical protein
MLLENGKYRAVVKDVHLHLRGEQERLTAAFRLLCEGKELVHREWLELNDGTISDKTIKRLRECFPKWDGSVETLEQGFCVQDVEVDVTVENEQDKQDPDKWWTRTKFMDPPGGGSGSASMPEKVNRATLVGKYGARFRALAGGTPARSVEERVSSGKPAAGATAVVAPSGPLAKRMPLPASAGPTAGKLDTGAPVSSLEECWEALCKKHPDELREQVSERWFRLLEQVVPGKDQADFSAEDWGSVLTTVTLPF